MAKEDELTKVLKEAEDEEPEFVLAPERSPLRSSTERRWKNSAVGSHRPRPLPTNSISNL